MMRELATGGAGCGEEGAGGGGASTSANPLSQLAGVVLGGGSKLREDAGTDFRSISGRGGISSHRREDFETAWSGPSASAFPAAGPHVDFEAAWSASSSRPAVGPSHAMVSNIRLPEQEEALHGIFHSFFDPRSAGPEVARLAASSLVQHSPAHPGAPLSPLEKRRVRDRLGILGRQVYGFDLGQRGADAATAAVVSALGGGEARVEGGGGFVGRGAAEAAADEWVRRHMDASSSASAGGWADEFSAMDPGGAARAAHEARRAALGRFEGEMWAQELHADATRRGNEWGDSLREEVARGGEWAASFGSGQNQWAEEFTAERERDASEGLRRETAAVADVMQTSDNPKMRNSQFLQFVSKMSRGELQIEGNKVVDKAAVSRGEAWAAEFEPTATATTESYSITDQWANEFSEADVAPPAWVDEFNSAQETWGEEFGTAYGASSSSSLSKGGQYEFQKNNKYVGRADAFQIAQSLFQGGDLTEAALAMEAALQQDPKAVEAWRLLGTIHAENDDDIKAILAMANAHDADPTNLEVLLSLGVSHTNELDREEALGYLVRWLQNHPDYTSIVPAGLTVSSNPTYNEILAVFQRAASSRPDDADVHVVLGVLAHLSRKFEESLQSFQRALDLRPEDYSLWNKIGVTLANGTRSQEATDIYRKALAMKPNYVRAWTNLGISYANVGDYTSAARIYVRSLTMNPASENIWSYLRMAVACAERPDLLDLVDGKNLSALQTALPLEGMQEATLVG